MLKLTPPHISTNGIRPGLTSFVVPNLNDVYESWSRLIRSRGARYIEFLALPQFENKSPELVHLYRHLAGVAEPCYLPNLKATVTICDDNAAIGPVSLRGGFIVPSTLLQYGCSDTFDLIRTVDMLFKAGDHQVKFILDFKLYFVPGAIPSTTALAIRKRWNYTCEMDNHLRSSQTFQPKRIEIRTLVAHDKSIVTDACLDSAYWLSRSGVRDGILALVRTPVEYLGACAKDIQTAAKTRPCFGTVNLHLCITAHPPADKVLLEIEKLHAVLRGTFLRASLSIAKRQIGSSCIFVRDQELNEVYRLGAQAGPDGMVTVLAKPSGSVTQLYQDAWPRTKV